MQAGSQTVGSMGGNSTHPIRTKDLAGHTESRYGCLLSRVTTLATGRVWGIESSREARLAGAFGVSADHGIEGEVRVVSTDFQADGPTVTWLSIRYLPGSYGQAASLTDTFDGDQIALISETGAPEPAWRPTPGLR